MTFIALPIVPDDPIGPFGGVNPREVWIIAIALACVSFTGYAAVKYLGASRGVLVAAALGGSSLQPRLLLQTPGARQPARARRAFWQPVSRRHGDFLSAGIWDCCRHAAKATVADRPNTDGSRMHLIGFASSQPSGRGGNRRAAKDRIP
jgi:hypothetical protein